jgi:aminopeptidase
MQRTDKVRIVSPRTDLTFSIKGMPAVICAGKKNLPDGEVFTAPIKDSLNGRISFNTPTTYEGITFSDIELNLKKGKIIKATSNRDPEMNQILNIDEGSRFIGEFAIGINPYILEPMDNGNRSSIHWDMVLIQRPEYGGGDIYFDDVLIRRDGFFVLPELHALNPNSLK